MIFKLLSTRELDVMDAASVVRSLGDDLERNLIAREVESLALRSPDLPIEARWRDLLSEIERDG